MKDIVIVGSDSFIASKLYDYIKLLFNVRLFSRMESGKEQECIINLFEICIEDFKGCEVVLNFAAIVHQPKLKNNELYKKVNSELPIQLATEAKKAGVKHFIQMSTIAVYGEVYEITENSNEKPVNIYGSTKLDADKALLSMQDESFIVTIIRPPMVYGGGKAPGNLISLINAAQKGIPMPFKGVNNKRDFIHVNNLVNALNIIIEKRIKGVVLPTDNNPVSTESIINAIKKYSNKRIRQVRFPGLIHYIIKSIQPKIYSKVFGSLTVENNLTNYGFEAKYTIEQGIEEMINAIP